MASRVIQAGHRVARALGARAASVRIEGWVTLGVVAAATTYTLFQLHPELLVTDTTPTGGDMGAHVWGPAYLRDNLLPDLRLTGWTPDWYAGFPAYSFYMVVPSLAIVALDLALPYGVAFKLVTVVGLLALPAAAWAFGRLSRIPFPGPAVLAVATLPFLFDREFTIYGGNIASTMAGEFAFSISLALSLVYLGVVARGLDTGRHRAGAAALLALTGLCHLIPAFFALAGTAVLFALRPGRAQARWLLAVGPVAAAVSAFWVLPFAWNRAYVNDMGWEKIQTWSPHTAFSGAWWGELGKYLWHDDLRAFVALALVGAVAAVATRSRAGLFLLIMAVGFGAAFVLAPQGRLWNARLLPFYYLCVYLLAGFAVSELGRALVRSYTAARGQGLRPRLVIGLASTAIVVEAIALSDPGFLPGPARAVLPALGALLMVGALAEVVRAGIAATGLAPARAARGVLVATPVAALLAALVFVALPLGDLPFSGTDPQGRPTWFGLTAPERSFVDGWARWNYEGYEGRTGNDSGGGYGEYHGVITTMEGVGEEHGCGRAMWEYEKELDRYGTPMALMLLPFWTDGCIGSMEGLFFEASATTPYHFLNQSELSVAPSRAQRDLDYGPFDLDRGVRHLQLMGVRYYLAFSEQVLDEARSHDDLTEVASSGPWVVFEVADADLVTGLDREPVVLEDASDAGQEWLEPSAAWYLDEDRRDVLLASAGPETWDRVPEGADPPGRTVPPVTVSDIEATDDEIGFRVDDVGSPVLVKASYFPNWEVEGAEGPYRVAPNLMVVVPTDTEVRLTYGRSTVELVAWALTLAGLVGLVLLARAPAPAVRRHDGWFSGGPNARPLIDGDP